MGFDHLFDRIYASSTIGHAKPESEFYQSILTDVQLDANAIWYFDDHEKNVAAALQLGIQSFVVTDTSQLVSKILTL